MVFRARHLRTTLQSSDHLIYVFATTHALQVTSSPLSRTYTKDAGCFPSTTSPLILPSTLSKVSTLCLGVPNPLV
jgi:hypothetical protein